MPVVSSSVNDNNITTLDSLLREPLLQQEQQQQQQEEVVVVVDYIENNNNNNNNNSMMISTTKETKIKRSEYTAVSNIEQGINNYDDDVLAGINNGNNDDNNNNNNGCCVADDDDDDDDNAALIIENNNNNCDNNNDSTTSLTDEVEENEDVFYRKTLFPDDVFEIYGIKFIDGPFAVKLFKFTIFTFSSIWIMYYVVRWMGWENDHTLKLEHVWRYEGNLIITDIMFYFVIGRLFKQRGIDHIEWIGWCILANLYSSYITDFKMFQHSFTLYEMHCRWPWQLWIFVLLTIPLIVTIAILHLYECYKQQIIIQKTLEMLFCITFLLFPLITSSYFHLHHWYAGLLIGMHFNFYNKWWSRACMAWCWGCYINGIAVYGRDPVLTCGYAYFMSVTQRCPFIHCYLEAMADPNHMSNNVTVDEMKPPNWRNCSADAYHP